MYSGSLTPQSSFQQQSYFMPTSPMSMSMTPTSQYFYQKQSSPPAFQQYSPNSSFTRNRYLRRSDETEPMSTSPIHLHQPSKEFLPSFLTGDSNQTSFSKASRGLSPTTPEKRRPLTVSFSTDPIPRNSDKSGHQAEDKKTPAKSGPPISGIGRVNENSPSPFFPVSLATSGSDKENLNTSTGFTPSITLASPISNSSMEGQGQALVTSCWVTVFGFSSSSISNVLAHFGHCGTILESRTVPGSNWIHLHYSNVIEARRALQRNGTLIGGTMMVGVGPCSEEMAKEALPPGVMDFYQGSGSPGSSLSKTASLPIMNKENLDPMTQVQVGTSSMSNVSANQGQLRGRMRSMGRDALELQVPQAKTGFISWALDTFFGW